MGKPTAPTPTEIQTLQVLSDSDQAQCAAKTKEAIKAARIARAQIWGKLKPAKDNKQKGGGDDV